MACYRPVPAWRSDKGEIFFGAERPGVRALELPCGSCLGCRLARAQEWALRCVHEASLHRENSFVTLTYSDEFYRPSLHYPDFQNFLKRLRRSVGRCRYFVCGEYGEQTFRPHFHALLFGVGFHDLRACGRNLYRSAALERLWDVGFSSVGEVNHASAGYVARYSLKKVVGSRAAGYYQRVDFRTGEVVSVVPEFARMSLRPGLGRDWFHSYLSECVVARDGVCLPGGRVQALPRFYRKELVERSSDLAEWRDYTRYVSALAFSDDRSPGRLGVREACVGARVAQLERSL